MNKGDVCVQEFVRIADFLLKSGKVTIQRGYIPVSYTHLRIKSDTSSDEGQSIYEGCFANIPEELLDRKVIECGQILASTNPEREGCYSLII